MILTGRTEKIDLSPYEAFLTLSDTNIKSIGSLTIQGSDDELVIPLDADQKIEIDVYVWPADNIEITECTETHYLIQKHDKNVTSGCGKVVKVIEADKFECKVNGLAGTIRIESEKNYDISLGDTIKFSGELHAKI